MNGIKKIYLKVYSDGTVISSSDVLGYVGEHMSSTLVFEIPEKLKSNNYTYTLNFEDDTGNVWSGALLDDYTFIVPVELMQSKILYVQLTILEADRLVFKGNCIEFKLHRGVDNVEIANKYTGLLEDTLEKFNNLVAQLGNEDLSKVKGVISIEKTGVNGLQDTYTVTYTDATTSTFIITNGSNGSNGDKGDKGEKGDRGEKGENYILTISDKLEIAKIISEEYPISAYRTVTSYTDVSDAGLTIKEENFEEGEI